MWLKGKKIMSSAPGTFNFSRTVSSLAHLGRNLLDSSKATTREHIKDSTQPNMA